MRRERHHGSRQKLSASCSDIAGVVWANDRVIHLLLYMYRSSCQAGAPVLCRRCPAAAPHEARSERIVICVLPSCLSPETNIFLSRLAMAHDITDKAPPKTAEDVDSIDDRQTILTGRNGRDPKIGPRTWPWRPHRASMRSARPPCRASMRSAALRLGRKKSMPPLHLPQLLQMRLVQGRIVCQRQPCKRWQRRSSRARASR